MRVRILGNAALGKMGAKLRLHRNIASLNRSRAFFAAAAAISTGTDAATSSPDRQPNRRRTRLIRASAGFDH
jgi:hypothetical protein